MDGHDRSTSKLNRVSKECLVKEGQVPQPPAPTGSTRSLRPPIPVRSIDLFSVPVTSSVHTRMQLKFAPVDSSHGKSDVSVLPSVLEQENSFAAEFHHWQYGVPVGPLFSKQKENLRESQSEDVVV
ncbi:hypothetical protein MRX96_026100 [Rhipicephalus microplus]